MGNAFSDIPIEAVRFREHIRGQAGENTLSLQRVAAWPQVRGNPTFLVPELDYAGMVEVPAPDSRLRDHMIEMQVRCPHSGKQPYSLDGSMRRYSEVCGYRPKKAISDYKEKCKKCGHARAWHGIIGVAFCVECLGPIRFFNESCRDRYGKPVGHGGLVYG